MTEFCDQYISVYDTIIHGNENIILIHGRIQNRCHVILKYVINTTVICRHELLLFT